MSWRLTDVYGRPADEFSLEGRGECPGTIYTPGGSYVSVAEIELLAQWAREGGMGGWPPGQPMRDLRVEAMLAHTKSPKGDRPMRQIFGPKKPSHPSIGEICPACRKAFVAGDFTSLVAIGPGDDLDSQRAAREGLPYSAVAVEVHAACAGLSEHK